VLTVGIVVIRTALIESKIRSGFIKDIDKAIVDIVKRGYYRNTDVVQEGRIMIRFRMGYREDSCRYNNERVDRVGGYKVEIIP